MAFRQSLIQWMKDYQPEHLESLLRGNQLDQWLQEKTQQASRLWQNLEAKGLDAWAAQEHLDAAFLPADQPEPEQKFTREGKRMLRDWEQGVGI